MSRSRSPSPCARAGGWSRRRGSTTAWSRSARSAGRRACTRKLAELVRSGAVGKVTAARACYASNMAPDGIGLSPDSDPPEGLDWDLWLGPRPARPFNEKILPYKFRWWHLYSSQMANWGVHYFDVMRWMVGETAPASLSAHGGVFAVKDARTIPDTAEVIFELASGMLMTFGTYEANGHTGLEGRRDRAPRHARDGLRRHGPRSRSSPSAAARSRTPSPAASPRSRSSKDGNEELDRAHARNFLDCVKSRQRPNADVEEGHRSTTFALLANIALATKARLDWDAKAERFTNNAAGQRAARLRISPAVDACLESPKSLS